MNNSTNDRFAAFVGIDWADAQHDLCLLSADADVPKPAVIMHTPEAIEDQALNLQRRFKGQPIAMCLELQMVRTLMRSATTISSCFYLRACVR